MLKDSLKFRERAAEREQHNALVIYLSVYIQDKRNTRDSDCTVSIPTQEQIDHSNKSSPRLTKFAKKKLKKKKEKKGNP